MADDSEIAEFCRRHHGRLYGAMVLQTGSRVEAEDVAQEALVRAVEHWPKVRQMADPTGWLFRVAYNLESSRGRRMGRWLRVRGRVVSETAVVDVDRDVDLARALAAMPERQRAAVILRYYADRSISEVAQTMGCSPGTVKALSHQGIAALRASNALSNVAPEDHERGEATRVQP